MKVHIFLLFVVVLIFFYHFYQKYRYYKVWWKGPKAFTFPFMGSLWFLLKMSWDINGFLSDVLKRNNSRMTCWMGQELVFLSAKPKDWEAVVKHPECLDKVAPLYDKFETIIGQGLPISRTVRWKHNRKLLNRGFTKVSIESYVSDMYRKSEDLMANLRKNFKPNDDMILYMYDYTMNTFIANFLGVDGELANQKYRWAEILNEFNNFTIIRMSHPIYNFDSIFFKSSHSKPYMVVVKKIWEFLQILVDESSRKIALKDSKEMDISQLLFNKVKDPSLLPTEEYMEELSSLILAGTDTTSLTMCFVLILFSVFKNMQEEIYTEIIEVMGKRQKITYEDLLNFKYLERFIYESLRMFPVVPVLGRKLGSDVDLGDTILPTGTDFIIFVYNIHLNPEYYPDPLRFDPDRFLPEECAKRNPYTYLAFSQGIRNCIGAKYAMAEMKMALANLVRNFHVTSNYKSIEDMETKVILFNKLKNGFNCTLTPR